MLSIRLPQAASSRSLCGTLRSHGILRRPRVSKQEKFTLNLEALGVAGDVRVIAFDLDDTLAVSKSRIDPEMAALLDRLLARFAVCIISGGRFEQFESQVLVHLGGADE